MNRWLRFSLYLLSIVLFAWIMWRGGVEAWQKILDGERDALLAALMLHGLAGVLSAVRLRLVAQALAGREVAPWWRFYHLNMTARALGLVLPRSVSTLGGKSVALRALGIPLKRSLWSIFVDNLFDVLLLAALAVPAIIFLQGRIEVGTFLLLIAGVWLLLGGGLWWGTATDRLATLLSRLRKIPWLARKLNWDSAVILLPSPSQSVFALFLTLLLNGAIALSYYFIGRAVHTPATWPIFLAIFPVTQLSLIVAIAPGGLGIFDLGWLGLLLLAGVPEADVNIFVPAQRAYVIGFVLVWTGVATLLSLATEKLTVNSPPADPLD